MAKKIGSSRFFLIPALFILSQFFVVTCSQDMTTTTEPVVAQDSSQQEIIYESSTSVLIPTYYELAKYSDIVIIGQVKFEVGVINTARHPQDSSKTDPRFFSIGTVYRVDVEKYLQGDGPNIIYIVKGEGKIINGGTPSPEEIEQVRLSSKAKEFTSLRTDKSYLMFLSSYDIWDDYEIAALKPGNLFVRTANPWLFDASDQKRVSVIDNNIIHNMFAPQSLDEILQQMDNPEIIPPTVENPLPAYPFPTDVQIDKLQPTTVPYPTP